MALGTVVEKGKDMDIYLVLKLYALVALLVMVAVTLWHNHRGRWSNTYSDHVAVILVGLGWPFLIPLGLLVLLVELTRHLSSGIRHDLDSRK